MTKKITIRFGVLTIMVILAALSRIIRISPNFAPIGALALFGAAYFSRKSVALIIPLISLWISDLVLNNTVYANAGHFVWFADGFYWVYGSFILIALLGFLLLKRIKPMNIIGANLLAAILFFVITNFGSWVGSAIYPQNFSGLVTCYVAGIPFFWNTLAGDIFYSALLFGIFELAQRRFPSLAVTV